MSSLPARNRFSAGLILLAVLANPLSAQGLLDSAKTRLAVLDGEVQAAGLDSAVEVRRDRWGVPHIYAKTQRDLFFAQGYVAAQDRLWQMEMWRRQGEGLLSEVLGPRYLERDRFARLLKFRGDMQAEWTSYASDTKEIVHAFVRGVNAYVRSIADRPPIEFSLLGFRPAPWNDEVPLQRMAALAMTGNALGEVDRAQLVAALGKAKVEAMFPTDPRRPLDPVPGLDLAGISPASLGAAAQAYGSITYSRLEGSNNWVIDGKHTATGKPLLANDPHRSIQLPSLRYLSHLVGPGWNVIGAGEPAVPGVAAGHNERIGFGFTIVGMDQQDVYVEKIGPCPAGVGRTGGGCYWYKNRWTPLIVLADTIPVKGEAARAVSLEFTVHGPIVAYDSAKGRAFALKFVGAEPGTAGYLAQVSVNRATDWGSFLKAAYRWRLPTENLIYADVDGNIGWIAAGLMPIRRWSGLLPVPGDGQWEWNGFLPFSALPQTKNPVSGIIVTANNNILPKGYTKPLNYEWATPFRANRVRQVLMSKKGWTREGFQALQHDEFSIPASELVPVLLAAAKRAGRSSDLLGVLGDWDFVMRKDAPQPLFYVSWVEILGRKVFEPRLGGSMRLRGRFDLPLLIRLVRTPDAVFGPNPAAARDSVVLAAYDEAEREAKTAGGPNVLSWNWGDIHLAPFRHPVAKAFDLPSARRGGEGNTVNSTAGAGYLQTHGASFREILDLADWDNSVATSVPGQSGQPGSEFYGNLLPLWEGGEYFPLVYSRGAVERETKHVLWLKP
ncbi:MAG: penicillin acylase family protein [Gemmatimonadota bacterium]